MKPNFALDLSHDGISLLHRAKGGWELVGEVALDDPEMTSRLVELRALAETIEPGGISTKLVIPNSQILYTTLSAPGPDDAAREVQIRAALEGLTPYPVADLVFDWRAQGDEARVAVLARETREEAEGFATEYQFNPVSFVARPESGEFSGEPFFGQSPTASGRVTPDASALPKRPRPMELPVEAIPESAPESAAESAPFGAPHPTAAPSAKPEPVAPPVAEEPVTPAGEPEMAPEAPPAPEPALAAAEPSGLAEQDAAEAPRPDADEAEPAEATMDLAVEAPSAPREDLASGLPPVPPTDDVTSVADAPVAPPDVSLETPDPETPDPESSGTEPLAADPAPEPEAPAATARRARRARADASGVPPVLAPFPMFDDDGDLPPAPKAARPTATRKAPERPPSAAPFAGSRATVDPASRREPSVGTGKTPWAAALDEGDGSPRPAQPRINFGAAAKDSQAEPAADAAADPAPERDSGPALPFASRRSPAEPTAAAPSARDRSEGIMRPEAHAVPTPAAKPAPAPEAGFDSPAAAPRGSDIGPDVDERETNATTAQSPLAAPVPPPPRKLSRAERNAMSPADRMRIDMADALSRPLPRPGAEDLAPATRGPVPRGPVSLAPEAKAKPAAGAGLAGAMSAARNGFGRFGASLGKAGAGLAAASAARKAAKAEAGQPERPIEPLDGVEPLEETPVRDAMPPLRRDRPEAASAPAVAPAVAPVAAPSVPPIGDGSGLGVTPTPDVPARPLPEATQPAFEPAADLPPDLPPAPAPSSPRQIRRKASKSAAEEQRAKEAEALTVFGARRTQATRGKPRYLGPVLVLTLLLAMAAIAVWSTFYVGDEEVALFNPGPDTVAPDSPTTAPEAETPETTPGTADETADETPVADALPAGEVLSSEAAEARYAATGIWQRAPDPLPTPTDDGLDATAAVETAPETAPAAVPRDAAPPATETAAATETTPAEPLAPPPPGTSFDLDENGLVVATANGAVSPTGILVFSGKPALVPPARPGALVPETVAPEAAAQAPAETVAETAPLPQAPDIPKVRPPARPANLVPADLLAPAIDLLAPPTVIPAPDGVLPQDGAALAPGLQPRPRPETILAAAEAAVAPAAPAALIDTALIDAAAADVVDAAFEGATELAVVSSLTPTHRPGNFGNIVEAALASRSDGSVASAAPDTTTAAIVEDEPEPVSVSPAIPTSASVASQATVTNALNLRQINLIGVYGTTSARRALVRLENGRYVKVAVGDKLDGGKVTSISATRLTYQKGSKAYALDILPLG